MPRHKSRKASGKKGQKAARGAQPRTPNKTHRSTGKDRASRPVVRQSSRGRAKTVRPAKTLTEILPADEIDEGYPPLEGAETLASRARRDADSMAGDELPGGTTAVPDNDRVDEIAGALGVERAPDSPVRSSGEILDDRDRRRPGRRPRPTL